MNIHKQRLLNVARACRETLFPSWFTMNVFGHPCGTPGCALGNYAHRTDLQDAFTQRYCMLHPVDAPPNWTYGLHCDGSVVTEHFGITESEANFLFSSAGCHYAQTALAAAEFIEAFAEAKWPEPVRNWALDYVASLPPLLTYDKVVAPVCP